MRRSVPLLIALLLALFSCSWTLRLNPLIGKRFVVIEPEKVLIYNEPSFKGEPFKLDKPYAFEIEALECADGSPAVYCSSKLATKEGLKENSFLYKVKFNSGKEGYISQRYFFPLPEYIISLDSPEYLGTALFHADYDSVWEAAIDTLDEKGFVIKQMKKDEGYLLTDFKKDVKYREKISVRLKKEDADIRVTIREYAESLVNIAERDKDISYWKEEPASGHYRKMILDEIAAKLKDQ